MNRRRSALTLAVCCLLILSGCTGRNEMKEEVLQTLPPAAVAVEAPDGDRPLRAAGDYTLYIQDLDALHLSPRQIWIGAADLQGTAEELVRQQLESETAAQAPLLGENLRLTLYGENPVEICGGVCTVNLGPAALRLPAREYYQFCVALATTLCQLDEVSFVNVLVADQSVGLDISGSLAMGSLTAHAEGNLPVLWEQMEAKRTPLGKELGQTPLNALATVYYPLPDGQGISCENRILNFEGQTPQQLASGLLQEMDQMIASQRGAETATGFPGLLLHEPLTSELEDGGRLITLSFREDLKEILRAEGRDLTCLMAAVNCSLTTFIPGIAAVCIRLGDKPITELDSSRFGKTAVLGGLLKRGAFSRFLMGSTTVYLPREGQLVPVERLVDRRLTDSPRTQIEAMMGETTAEEKAQGIEAALPPEAETNDILGIAATGGVLAVNFSESFRSEIQAFGPEREMLLCYAIVNTLCLNSGFSRVCFFFEGEQVETIAGSVYWAGEFIYNPGLTDPGLG